MKKCLAVFPLVLLVCFALGCQKGEKPAEEPVTSVEADVQAIRNLCHEAMESFNTGDLERLLALFDDDAVFMPPQKPFIMGKVAIRGHYHFDQVTYNVAASIHEIQVRGDRAYLRFSWEGTSTQNGETNELDLYEIDIFKKGPDGSWKALNAIWY